jgi:hypothetical protein
MCSPMTGFALAVIDLVILTLIFIFYTPVVLIPYQTVIRHEKGAYLQDQQPPHFKTGPGALSP